VKGDQSFVELAPVFQTAAQQTPAVINPLIPGGK
jgi:hypothetical protein